MFISSFFSSYNFYLPTFYIYYHFTYYYYFFPFFLFFSLTSCTLFPTNKPRHPQCRRIILEYEGALYQVEVKLTGGSARHDTWIAILTTAGDQPVMNVMSAVVNVPFADVSKLGHFRSLHDAPVHSAV